MLQHLKLKIYQCCVTFEMVLFSFFQADANPKVAKLNIDILNCIPT